LKLVNENKYLKLRNEIEHDLKIEAVAKYEYWADHPFCTKGKPKPYIHSEKELLKLLYPEGT
jgi:hypothetical protein